MQIVRVLLIASFLVSASNLRADDAIDSGDYAVQSLGVRDFLIDVGIGCSAGGSESAKVRSMVSKMARQAGMNNADSIRVRKITVGDALSPRSFGFNIMQFLAPVDVSWFDWKDYNETSVARHAILHDVPLFPKYLFIDERFFDELTPQAQKFLVAQNLMKLKYKHTIAKWFAYLLIDYAVYEMISARVPRVQLPHVNVQDQEVNRILNLGIDFLSDGLRDYAILLATKVVTPVGISLLSKMCVLHADDQAVREFNVYDGALEYLQKLEHQEQQFEADLPQWQLMVLWRMIKRFTSGTYRFLYGNYPANSTRIAMLRSNNKSHKSQDA